jgi:hypothetical protein
VEIKASYDVWSTGMTLLAVADIAVSPSSLEQPCLFAVKDLSADDDDPVLVRSPEWIAIDTAKIMEKEKRLFKKILDEDELMRISAEDVISVLC